MGVDDAVLGTIALGILVTLVAGAQVGLRIAARRRFDLLDIFVAGFGAVYGACYAFVVYASNAGQNAIGFRVVGNDRHYWIVPALALVCLAAIPLLGALLQTRAERAPRTDLDDEADDSEADESEADESETDWQGPIRLLGWCFLITALLASTLYTRAYGGFAGFFEVASALRSGLFEEAGANAWSFVKPFGGFSVFSTYLFAACLVAGPRAHAFWCAAGFIGSLAVSSVTLYGWGGRVDLLIYWVTVVFGFLVWRGGVSPRLIAGLAMLAVVTGAVLPPLTDAMNPGKSRGSYVEFFAAELTFPVESALNAIELDELRLGADIVAGPAFILPERIWSTWNLRNISDLNSDMLLGDLPREGFGYTIPVDILTFGLWQFGLAGPLIIVLGWCLALSWLDRHLVTKLPRSLSAFLYAHAVFSVVALAVLYFDPKMQIARNFHYIVGLLSLATVPWWSRSLTARGHPEASSYPDPTAPDRRPVH